MTGQSSVHPFLIAIAGGSASGKTTLAGGLADALGPSRAARIELDSYYRDLSDLTGEQRAAVNFDHPDALDLDAFRQDMVRLRLGHSIEKPVYDFAAHRRADRTETVAPKPVIIVDGLFVLHPGLTGLFDLRIFVEAADDLRLIRRIRRDTNERGRDLDGILDQYLATVRPMHEQFVVPTQVNADLDVDGTAPTQQEVRQIISHLRDRKTGCDAF